MTAHGHPKASTTSAAGEPGELGLFAFFNEIGIINQLASAFFTRLLPDGVHVAHFAILNHMARLGDDRTPQQLASAMQVTKATMTHSLQVLTARGFITLHPDPDDGRSKRVRLTDRGRAFRDAAIAAVETGFAPIAAQLAALPMAAVTETLRKVRIVLDESR